MAFTAAAMYGGAAFVAFVQAALPGGSEFSLAPGAAAFVVVVLLVFAGPRLPLPALAALGPLGVALIGYSLATTETHGDGELLYIWPVLWVAYFFGRKASALIVGWIGLVYALVLISLPPGVGYLDRWLDVMVSVSVVALVVNALSERNKRLVARLEAEARVDQLTGVLNRRGFEERARVELERAAREQAPVAAVSFDIDRFKRVNDEHGHEAGDRVLAHLGAVLRAETRGVDVAARLGGEEFVVLLAGVDVEHARRYAERTRRAFSEGVDLGPSRLTMSAGVTVAMAPARLEALLKSADAALYAAKRAGRDRTVVRPLGALPDQSAEEVGALAL
jgi:diguanylate cyclase (GGDEF)-like protein